MKLIINGNIKPYYIQMLAMLFYPGEKFPDGAEAESEQRLANVFVEEREDGVFSRVSVKDGEDLEEGETFLTYGLLDRDKTIKFAVGGAFLDACEKLTGHAPPWGMLTGVRPAKLALELLDKGVRGDDAVKFFTDVYRTTLGKAKLAVKTAEASERIVTPDRFREISVYIAIPFCPTRCTYCSFVSYTSPKLLSMIPEYLAVLLKDVKRTFELARELGLRVASVYIGGGTPTVLDEPQLKLLLECVSSYNDGFDEFTLEAGRPDTITDEKLRLAKEYGVTRISVNTQTLNEEVLRNIGRAHSADDFFTAYEKALKMGIRDINVDLIAGLPGDTYESFCDSVDRVVALDPTNITVHSFSVKKSAEMKTGGHDVFDRDGFVAVRSVDYSQDKLFDAGYIPYYMYRQKNTVGNLENVGYSKIGHEGLYNIFMMDEIHTILSCGASAVTKIISNDNEGKLDIKRIFEPKYPYEYLRLRESEEYAVEKKNTENLLRSVYLK